MGDEPARSFGMVDVARKPVTLRRAVATGRIVLGPEACEQVASGTLPKGDALSLARFAAILGAKQTPQLIPLCHPINLNRVLVRTEIDRPGAAVWVCCLVEIAERTGVEMEALTAVSTALLTIWDLAKPVNAALAVDGVRLVYKEGGKSGAWTHPAGITPLAAALLEEARQ